MQKYNLILLLTLFLIGCGYSGPLVLPSQKAKMVESKVVIESFSLESINKYKKNVSRNDFLLENSSESSSFIESIKV